MKVNYYTEKQEEVKVGDIIEFPTKTMQYHCEDIVGILAIKPSPIVKGEVILELSDGFEIHSSGSEFWKAKLLARKLQSERCNINN